MLKKGSRLNLYHFVYFSPCRMPHGYVRELSSFRSTSREKAFSRAKKMFEPWMLGSSENDPDIVLSLSENYVKFWEGSIASLLSTREYKPKGV